MGTATVSMLWIANRNLVQKDMHKQQSKNEIDNKSNTKELSQEVTSVKRTYIY